MACWLGFGCSAYDPGLLELSAMGSTLRADAGAAGLNVVAAGMLVEAAGTAAQPAAGSGGGGAGAGGAAGAAGTLGQNSAGASGAAGADTTPTTRCGDGLITGGEKCDPGIAAGQSGACPTDCPALGTCVPRALNGTGCQSECILVTLSCKAGDGCCPGECTTSNDADCSASCGDGIVEKDRGETCEPKSNTPCMTSTLECDDKNACTLDKLMGSAQNCNTACVNTPITAAMGDDGCCPAGANANTDTDCKPMCGNAVRETGEDCDGGVGCSTACKLTLQPQQLSCLERFGSDACARCSCMNCVDRYMACRASTDANANTQCNDIIECARTNSCLGPPCYCTDPTFCSFTPGPCNAEIAVAAGTTNPFVILDQSNDLNTAVGRAYAADRCRVTQCADVCRGAAD